MSTAYHDFTDDRLLRGRKEEKEKKTRKEGKEKVTSNIKCMIARMEL